MRSLADGDEELGAVGARPGIGHRQQVRPVELQFGMELVVELVARPAATCSGGIAALDHEAVDHPVKYGAVVERSGGASGGVLRAVVLAALCQSDEIRDGLGGMVSEQCDFDVTTIGVQGRGRCLYGARHGESVCHAALTAEPGTVVLR